MANVDNAQQDDAFLFQYNFNKVNQLAFSTDQLFGVKSLKTPILINPSINSESSQNMVKVEYKNGIDRSNLSATITNISICKNFFTTVAPYLDTYVIILSGSILTQTNSNLYILIPFKLGALDNTASGVEIKKLLDSAVSQLDNKLPTTMLSDKLVVNSLIDPESKYVYSNVSMNNVNHDTNFFIFKKKISTASNNYLNLFNTYLNFPYVNPIKSATIFYNKNFIPSVEQTNSINEIMINCSPVEMTTKVDNTENVMFKTGETYGSDTKSNYFIIMTIMVVLISSFFLYCIFRMGYNIWKKYIKQNLGSGSQSAPAP